MPLTWLRLIVAAGLAIAVAGCDGGGDAAPPTMSPASTTSPTATASPTDGEIPLPDDVVLVFDWRPTGDANTDAAVGAVIQLERAQAAVVAFGDRAAAPYARFVTGAAKVVVERYFDANIDAGLSLTGINRYFDFEVSGVSNDHATVVFCVDGWDFFAKNRTTGEVFRVRDPNGGVRVTDTVRRTGTDRWQVDTTSSREGVPSCRLEH